MTKLELPDGMGPAEALRGFADDLLAPGAKLRAFVDFGKEGRWDSGPLEGATHGGFLRLVADLIDRKTTRNPADDTTMPAYDVLPEDERKVIAWVREHGGIEECDRKVEAFMEVGDKYTLLRMELGKMLGYDLMGQLEASDEELVEKVGKRLMPEGIEWPMFEDGEPVRFGDVVSDGYETGRVYYVTFDTANPVIIGFTDETPDQDPGTWLEVSVNDGERVKRRAKKLAGVS